MGGEVVAGPAVYDVRLSDTAHDSRWYSAANMWHATAPLAINDYDTSGYIAPLFSFLGTSAFSAAGVSIATLTLDEVSVDQGGTWIVQTELANDAPKGIWDTDHRPPATALSTATQQQTSTTGAPTEHSIDVTAMVNEVMASTYWSPGDPINFIARPDVPGAFIGLTLVGVPGATAARLQMTSV